jgi:hypothetical protein
MSINERLPHSQILQLMDSFVKDLFDLIEGEEIEYSVFWLAFYSDLTAMIKQEYWERRI